MKILDIGPETSLRPKEPLESIACRQYQEQFNYTLCPHTACGISACEQLRDSLKWPSLRQHAMVVLGTAHPGKFADNVLESTGVQVTLPPALDALMTAQTRYEAPWAERGRVWLI